MKIRIDNILLGTLWLLAVTLGASFWFNTIFGFNILSVKHWEYISYLQAAKTPINSMFYVSFVITVFVAILGLYVLIRPRLRKIRLPIVRISNNKPVQTSQPEKNTQADASTLDVTKSAEIQKTVPTAPSVPQHITVRPPRLNLPIASNMSTPVINKQPTNNTFNNQQKPADKEYPEIQEIFASAGYTVKKNPIINGIKTALLAIGSDEVLWIGAVGIKTTELRAMIDKLSQVFSDTLDDIYININGFVLFAPDEATAEFQNILMFNSITQLKEYMETRKNPTLPEEEKDNFDAYSEYIDTVINYIGKI